jgi:hypothetical protein
MKQDSLPSAAGAHGNCMRDCARLQDMLPGNECDRVVLLEK